jgi:hypothetical protein
MQSIQLFRRLHLGRILHLRPQGVEVILYLKQVGGYLDLHHSAAVETPRTIFTLLFSLVPNSLRAPLATVMELYMRLRSVLFFLELLHGLTSLFGQHDRQLMHALPNCLIPVLCYYITLYHDPISFLAIVRIPNRALAISSAHIMKCNC